MSLESLFTVESDYFGGALGVIIQFLPETELFSGLPLTCKFLLKYFKRYNNERYKFKTAGEIVSFFISLSSNKETRMNDILFLYFIRDLDRLTKIAKLSEKEYSHDLFLVLLVFSFEKRLVRSYKFLLKWITNNPNIIGKTYLLEKVVRIICQFKRDSSDQDYDCIELIINKFDDLYSKYENDINKKSQFFSYRNYPFNFTSGKGKRMFFRKKKDSEVKEDPPIEHLVFEYVNKLRILDIVRSVFFIRVRSEDLIRLQKPMEITMEKRDPRLFSIILSSSEIFEDHDNWREFGKEYTFLISNFKEIINFSTKKNISNERVRRIFRSQKFLSSFYSCYHNNCESKNDWKNEIKTFIQFHFQEFWSSTKEFIHFSILKNRLWKGYSWQEKISGSQEINYFIVECTFKYLPELGYPFFRTLDLQKMSTKNENSIKNKLIEILKSRFKEEFEEYENETTENSKKIDIYHYLSDLRGFWGFKYTHMMFLDGGYGKKVLFVGEDKLCKILYKKTKRVKNYLSHVFLNPSMMKYQKNKNKKSDMNILCYNCDDFNSLNILISKIQEIGKNNNNYVNSYLLLGIVFQNKNNSKTKNQKKKIIPKALGKELAIRCFGKIEYVDLFFNEEDFKDSNDKILASFSIVCNKLNKHIGSLM